MVVQVLSDIQDFFLVSAVGSGICLGLAAISFFSLQLAIHSALFVGSIMGTIVSHFLMFLCVTMSITGMVTQTA